MKLGRLIGTGTTAEVYELDENSVLKLFRKEIPESHSKREYDTARAVNNCEVPSPKVLEWVQYEGRFGIVYEYVKGKSMLKELLNPWRLKKHAELLAILHHRIHMQKPTGLLPYKQRLLRDIEKADLLSEQEKQAVIVMLEALPDGDSLCHGDFHPDNIMLFENNPIVLDWMTAGIGDPAADVARTSLILITSQLPNNIPLPVKKYIQLMRQFMYSVYIKKYCELSRFTKAQIDAWMIPIAASRLAEWRPKRENDLLLHQIRSHI